MNSKKNLILLGMMGVGKTKIGKFIAKKLNRKFYDIDNIIEKKNNMKIFDIFKLKGESFFRREEELVALEYLKKDNCIISLGGGTFLNEKVRNMILLNSVSFWIVIKNETIKNRLKNSKKRPLINMHGIDGIDKLINDRKKFYSLANFKINCDMLTLNQISNKIIKLL